MKIEKINENKIKVLIDIDEAKEWNEYKEHSVKYT